MAPAVTETHARLKWLRQKLAAALVPGPPPARPIDPGRQYTIQRLLILRPVHSLGNLLGLTPLLSEIENVLPEARVDVLAGVGVVNDICRCYNQVEQVVILPRHAFRQPLSYFSALRRLRNRPYDLLIDPAARSRTATTLAGLLKADLYIGPDAPCPMPTDLETVHFAQRPVQLLRYHLPWARDRLPLPSPPLDLRLQAAELSRGAEILRSVRLQHELKRPGILALFAHATWKKAYPAEWWRILWEALKQRFENHDIVEILPAHGESRLDFAIPTIHSLDIRELGSVLAHCCAFIGADSGIVHLASASGTPTFSLFSVTDPDVWRPYGPSDMAIETAQMTPQEVASAVHDALSG